VLVEVAQAHVEHFFHAAVFGAPRIAQDYKICSLDGVWSGMVFTVKKARG